jgi:hypothetical protein
MVEPAQPEIPTPPGPAPSPSAGPGLRCPWCSTPVESLEDATCGACGATLHGDPDIEIPGVTAIDGEHAAQAAQAAAPRKVRRSFGSLFVGRDDQIPAPSQAELPALAPPDGDVRREMLRLQLDAELADLAARAAAIAAERGVPLPGLPGVGSGFAPDAEGDLPPLSAAAISEPGPGAPAPALEAVPPASPPEAVPPAVESRPRRPRRRSAGP